MTFQPGFIYGNQGNDPFTKLLLHCDGTNGSTAFTDVSASGHAVTAAGSAQVDTSQKVFGTGSALLGAIGNYLTIADSADWDFAADPFVVDCWLRYASVPAGAPDGNTDNFVFWQEASASSRFHFGFDGTSAIFHVVSGGVTVASYRATHGMAINQFYHWAVIRSGATFRMTRDGVALSLTTIVAVGASAMPNVAAAFFIGGQAFPGPGWVDEFRVSKGTDRGWTANFNPPARAYG